MADIIDELKGLDDAALAKKLGFADKVVQFKKDLEDAAALKGPPREKVVATMNRIFGPDNYELQDFHRTVDRAVNPPKKPDATAFVNSCGCMDEID